MVEDSASMQTVFKRLDEHTGKISKLEEQSTLADYRLNIVERDTAQTNMQIKTTEGLVMQSIKLQGEKLDALIAEQHRQEGAKNAVRWIPTIVQLLVWLTVLYTFFSIK
jgi:hypothetical protein